MKKIELVRAINKRIVRISKAKDNELVRPLYKGSKYGTFKQKGTSKVFYIQVENNLLGFKKSVFGSIEHKIINVNLIKKSELLNAI